MQDLILLLERLRELQHAALTLTLEAALPRFRVLADGHVVASGAVGRTCLGSRRTAQWVGRAWGSS